MLTTSMTKKLIVGAAFATLMATPTLAQSYTSTYGAGNVVNVPRAERTHDRAGRIGSPAGYSGRRLGVHTRARLSAGSGLSAYAYAPARGRGFSPRGRYSQPTGPMGPRDLSIESQR